MGQVVVPVSGGKLGSFLGEVKGEVHGGERASLKGLNYRGEGRKELF